MNTEQLSQVSSDRDDLLKAVVAQACADQTVKNSSLLAQFIRRFYANVAEEDLLLRSIEDLSGAVLSHWQHFQICTGAEPSIRVYNPHFEQHHWQSTHTIVEVCCADMPFLVDSLRMEMNRQGYNIHFLINTGPLMVSRDEQGKLSLLLPEESSSSKTAHAETVIYFEVDRQTDLVVLKLLEENLLRILKDVRVAVEDWGAMKAQLVNAINYYEAPPAIIPAADVAEGLALMRWLLEHFTFLGFRHYQAVGSGSKRALRLDPRSGLGVLRDHEGGKRTRYYSQLPEKAREQALSSQLMIISKTNTPSTVHRQTYTDYIGVKEIDKHGKIVGEWRFIGLFTSDVYDCDPTRIPLLRQKIEQVLNRSKLRTDGYAGKRLIHVLKTLPRDDLMQASQEELFELVMGISHLEERRKLRLFIRKDAYNRYLSCFVYVPRDHYNTELRRKMKLILSDAFYSNDITVTPFFSESILARIHYHVRIDPKRTLEYDVKRLEKRLREVARSWQDDLRDALLEHFGEEQGNRLFRRYQHAFPASYREASVARAAAYDIGRIEQVLASHQLVMSYYRPQGEVTEKIRFKLFRFGSPMSLSDALPIFDYMGLRVFDSDAIKISLPDGVEVWLHEFGMHYCHGDLQEIEELKELFKAAFTKIWYGLVENDGFNRLVLAAGLDWRQITVLRAYAKYLRQTRFPFSQSYVEEALSNHPKVTAKIVQLFAARFDPEVADDKRATEVAKWTEELSADLDAIQNLDEDRILRRFFDVVLATLRTNVYQQDSAGRPKTYLSFKFDPERVPDLPLPLPMFECFIYSPRFEGVHLRQAKVARGGLRWSDRPEDFRTEILGLVKAQQVKNSLIVPSGAKGGFVPKNLPVEEGREAMMAEAIGCYKNFIRGLLDITDNLVEQAVVHPLRTVIYDEPDPYLVVAADKGTATFSDTANAISEEYGFWLGDAFASGGSAGYDHKKMGITARGVWESVKRHFYRTGRDVKIQPFTVVGIGDMSGDVFGNGMLLSKQIRLVAAFNHQHIFLDPDPDPARSFAERARLFALSRSAWSDYKSSEISKGGGVYSRKDKWIPISPEMQAVLGITASRLGPNECIRQILMAPVDLLWNGGIGTYVKAATETHREVGDLANDHLRIDGHMLRCKVVGEGGNLGLTQLARVEYELSGGQINTDFIDNASGVDCSDHEVNAKILLNQRMLANEITQKQRDALLCEMTDDVSRRVLYNNYRQNITLSLVMRQSENYFTLFERYLNLQEQQGLINRSLEFLPDAKQLVQRRGQGRHLTRPELAVILAYGKINLKAKILASALPDDPEFATVAHSAFPDLLQSRYPEQIASHYLQREIMATQLSNAVVSDMGVTFVYQMNDELGASMESVVRAYMVIRAVMNMDKLWQMIEQLEGTIDAGLQYEMFESLTRLVRRGTRWLLLNNKARTSMHDLILRYQTGVAEVQANLPSLLPGAQRAMYRTRKRNLIKGAVPEMHAHIMATLRAMYCALNIVEAARKAKVEVKTTAAVYFLLAERLGLNWLRDQINHYAVDNHWGVLARVACKGDLDYYHRLLAQAVLQAKPSLKTAKACVEAWETEQGDRLQRWRVVQADLQNAQSLGFTMLSVALRQLMALARMG